MEPAENGRPRRRPPLWLLVVWIALGGFALWIHSVDTDPGFRNVGSLLAAVFAVLFAAIWFLSSRAFPKGLRLSAAAGLLAAAVFLFRSIEFDGFSGAMVPTFRWSREAAVATTEALGTRVDLTSTTADDFAGFLGSRRDAFVAHTQLHPDWEAHPPRELWRRSIGEGWSSFAIVNGTAVTQEQRGDSEMVSAYDVETGELLWTQTLAGRFENLLGDDGPRATPTISEGRVVALSAHGHLLCVDGSGGEVLWRRDLKADYQIDAETEARQAEYGRANSPLVFDGQVVVPVGGDPDVRAAGLAAFALDTGDPLWESPPRGVSYASPTLATLAGQRQILTVNRRSVSGHDPSSGGLLWEFEWDAPYPSVSQPVAIAPDRLFVSKGYAVGSALLQLVPSAQDRLEPKMLWRERRALRTKFTNVVIAGDYVYGLSDGTLECVELATGERQWKEGRYGHGQILRVADHLLIVSEEGEVLLHALDPAEPRVLGSFEAVEGKTWNNPALYGDVLLVRNASEVAAFRLATR